MKNSIYPCLWFDQHANQAAEFYYSVFSSGEIISKNDFTSFFKLNGTPFLALNGGDKYKVNPAISYYVYCGNEEEITRLYNQLIIGGEILMPLDKYDWSPKYAWISDQYGVNWQLDIASIDSEQKIVPSLLFANQKMGNIQAALSHYGSIFPESEILIESQYHESANLPAGTILFAQFQLSGFRFNSMSSTHPHEFDFTPGNSFVVQCDNQEEIDHYWEKLGEGGAYNKCGWLDDKFGVSWQIVPAVLGSLMADPDKAQKVAEAFMKMDKFIIADLESA